MSDSKKIVAQNGEIMLSARKAAKRLSCAPDYVGKLCREGKLEGERVDNAWFVRESSIVAFETARTEARTVRSQELALERQKEQDTYRKNNGLPLQRKETPAFLQKYTSNIFSSAAGRSAAFALGGAFLFASLVFAGQVATPQSGPFTFSAGAQEASALASVQSPFFSAPPLAPVFAANSSQGNFFSSVLAFLFGNHSSKIAEQTTPTPTPVAEQPVAPAQNTPSVVASVSPATLTPAGTIVENKTYPVIERTVVETHSGVTQASLDTQLQELSNSLRQVIFSSVNSDHGAVYSSGGVTNNVALSQIINSLSGVAISGGTITGARISGGSISGLSGLDLASGCFSVAGVCISSGGNAAGSTGAIQFNTGGAFDASSTQFVWDAVNNRLGIGTSTPMQALSLGAGGVISITSNDGSSNGCFKEVSGQLQYSNDCSTYQSFTAAAAGGWTDTGAIVHLTTGSANVGIGTSTPYAKLTVWGADTSASTNAFEIANAASTTLLSVNDAGQTTLLDLFATGSTTLQKVTATQATTSALFTSMLGIGVGNYFTSLLGTGLSNNAGVLTVSTTSLGLLGSTSLSASAPLSYNTNTGGFSISQSGLATNGYLSSGDFTTFNNKISSTSLSASGPLSYNSATGAFAISQAGVAQNGYISSGDFSTFNNKISSSSLSGSGVISYNSSTGSFNTTPGTFGGANAYTFPAGLIVAGNATTTNLAVTGSASSTNFTVSSLGGSGTSCVQADASGKLSSTGSACGSGSGAVNSVANSDGTLTISPTTGAVVASLNTAHTNIFTGLQQFSAGASTTQLSAGLAYFGATATSSFNGAGVLTLAGGLNGPLQANNGVVSATSSIGVLYGGTGTTTAPSYGQILVGNILGGYDLVGTSSLGIVSSGGLTFGKSWEITNGYLAPTTTLGIIVAASSTIGNGTQAGGLTINGGATTTGNALVQGTLQVLGTGTSTFTTNIGIAGNIIPATTNTYSLGSIANTWKDIYVGPGSLFVNGQEVLHTDGSNNVVVSSSINQNLVLQTTGTANIELNPSGTGQLLIKSGILLTGGKSFTTSDSSAVLFPSGVTGGNLTLSGNTITPTVLNSGISLTPNGSGGTYVTAGNFGIGTTTPATTLSVVGSGYITGGFGVGVLNTTPGTLVVAGNTTLANATTTNFAITNISSALLKATASGSVVPAVAGVDYAAAGASAFGKSWEITNGYLAPTTTLGIIVAASSTIGNGAQAGGLTIAGGATTTGSLQVNGGITVNGSLKLAGTTGSVQCLQVGSNGVITGTGSICGSGGGGSSTFLGLSDVPGAYIANQVYYTNSSATGVAGNNNFTFNDVTNTLTASNISTPTLTVSGSSSFGTVIAGIWHGTAIADAYVADNLTISAGTINNTPIGASVPSTGVFTNATTTNLAAYNLAQFGGTATSSFSSTGALTLATALTVPSGGTGSTTLGGLLTGNGTGAVISATVSAPLTFSGNTLAISQATLSQNGYLSSTDFTTFDNKISSTSLSGGTGISYAPATGVITNTGVTSNVAGTGISLSGATGAVTITNSGVTSLAGTANQITVSGSTGAVTLSLPSQLIIQNASTTNLSANTVAFGATGTTSIASNGTLTTPALTIATLSGLLKATAGVVSVASAGSDYENPLTFNYPLTRSTNAISLAFGTTTANTYSLLQTFNGGASTTNLTISNVPSSLLSTNVSGAAQATTVSLPLSFSGSTLSLSQSGTGANGYLSSTDFNTFNNKISSTSLSASAPLGYNSSTGAFSITQATTGTNGYLSSADFTTFNNKLSSTSLQTSALLAGLLSDETGSGSVVFSASPTFSGLAIFGSASTSQVSATTAYFGGTATSSFSSTGALTLATALTVQSGGTGSSTPLGGILAGNGASAVKSVVIGTGLTFDGTTLATNGGGITAIGPAGQTQTGGTQLLATSTTGTDFTITASTNTQTFNLPFASLTATGKLSSANFFTFNNKISSTSLSGQSVISYNSGGTGIITTTGGTFGAGDYIFPGNLTATAGLATFGNASTTNLSAYTAAFGGSATSSFSSTGALTLATALGIANGGTGAASFGQGWLFSNGGTGALAASTSPTVNYLFASSTTATSTFNGGFSAAGSLFVLQNGAVGIGNSTPGKTFDVTGTGRFSSTLTLSDAGTISCSGTKALQTDVQGNVVCSTVSMGSLSTAGGWTEDNAGTVSLTNISDSVAMGATSTPYAKLAILSGSAATTTLALVPASGQTANIIDIYNTSGALASVFTAAGRLGIGTTSPFATLSVAGNGFFNSDLTASNITATGTLVVGGTLSAGGTTLVTTAGGNVGIGTSSPTSLLSIVGGNITHTASGNPALATSVPALATAHSYKTYVSGNYAYEAEYEGGLRIFDVSNPKNPVSAGSYSTYAKVDDVIVAGKYAYLADAGSGIVILDVSNPSAPTFLSNYAISFSGYAIGIALSGKYLLATDINGNAVRVIDVSDPVHPALAGSYNGGGSSFPRTVAVSGKYAYVGDYNGSVYTLDISNPAVPAKVSTSYTTNVVGPSSLYVSGKYLYVADVGGKGMYVLNISNPASLSPAGTYNPGGTSSYEDVKVAGSYAYLADDAGNLAQVDIRNKAQISPVGSYALGGIGRGVALAGKYAYVSADTTGLQIIDINGLDTPAANIGSLAANILNVSDSLNVGGDIYAGGGLDVGVSGIFSRGGLSVFGSTTLGATLTVNGTSTLTGLATLTGGLLTNASSTLGNFTALFATTSQATTTNFAITSIGSGNLLKTTTGGAVVAAVAGTDYATPATITAFKDWGIVNGALTPTTTLGIVVNASSTIGDGTQAGGLTISGGSTTTLNAYFASNVGIGSTTPYSTLSVTGTTTSTGGFNVDSNANLLSYQGSTTISVMGTNNFFAGLQANGSTTKANGTDNIFIGNAAGYAVTSNQNVYIGSQSGIGSTTGAPNSGFGNTAVGYQTLQFNSTGSVNTANGYSALQNNTTGNGNSAFGYHALFYNTTGSSNTANGYQTLYWNTTGSSNTANGMSALYHNTTGSINTANGYQALYSNSTGSNNAANGYNALGSNTTGTNNTAMGYLAGYSVTTGYSNTFIGDYTTSNNTITTGGGNIGLGSNVFFPSATGNNQLNIGGILFGALPATTTAFKLPTSGSIGVGTSSPWAKFSIATNNGDTNTVLFAIGSSTQTATTTLFSVSNTGFTNVQANGTAGGFESKVVNPPDVLNTSGTLADTFVNTTIATDITQSQSNTSHGLTGLYTELSASQSLVATTSKWKAVEINSDTEHENITTYGAGLLLDSPFMQMSAPNILPNYVALDVNGNDTATRYGQPGDGMYVGLTSKITNLYGIRVGGAFIDGAAAVNNNYGINIGAPCTGSCDTGNIYNNYGLYIADQSTGNSGATSTYAIYSNGGKSYFDDSVGIGSTTPTAKLTVQNTFWDNSYYGNNSGLLFLVASSTAANGSTATNLFSISNTGSTTLYQLNSSLLKTDANGTIVAAVAGTDYITGAGLGSAYPFQVAGNATSTLTQFNGGLTAYASSTIGNGTQAGGLTINGGATTTGNAYFAGNVGIGSTSPAAVFSVLGRNGVPTNKNAPIAFYVQGGNGIGGGTNGGIGGDILFIAGNGSSGASGDSRAGNLTITAGNGSSGNGTGVGGNITINPGATGGGGAGNIILANLQGNVGIGTTSPFAKLSVQGNGYLSGNLTATNITATGTLAVSGLSTLSGGLTAYASSTIGNGTQTGGLTISGGATTTGNLVVQGIATANTFNASGASTTLISLNGQSLLAASSTNGSFFLGLGAGTTTLNSGIYANDNFGVGYQALQANTGANNFAVGYQAGFSNTTGGNNNFFGNQAGYFNTTGGSNNFLGNSAGWSNTTGFSNNFLGNYAGGGNTTGTDNNFLGNSAGGNNTTGTDNNFLGYQAGYFNTTGGNNNFIGHGAGASNTTGSGNIAIGTDALWSDVGAYNADTGIGFQVAYGGSGTFASSTFLGYQAGYNNVASQNTFIGALSGQNLTSGTNSIALGYNALFPSTTNNNQLNVGNLLFGTLPAASDTATAFKLPIAGALGVGTSSPYAKFAIQTNNGDTSKVLFAIGSSTASATTTLFSINNIGLISGLNLNLTGGATSTSFAITSIGSGNLLKTTTGGAIIAAVAGVDYLNTDTNWAMLNGALTPTTTTLGIGIFGSSTIGNGTQAGGLTISGGATTTGIAYFASNVGIGTTSPYSTLSVNGTTTSTGGFNVDSNTNLLSYQGSTTISVTGTNNFFAGLQANGSTTKANGTDNVFIGNAAGYAVTSNSNVYIGSFSGVGSTTGAPNSGAYNTAVGIATLKFNSTGGSNAAFGALALQKNTTGSRNNAFGASSLGKNTTGQDNNAFGVSALTNNTTGSNNTAYGAYALTGSALGTNTGSGNTAIGYYALAGGGFVTNDTGTNNTALGFQAGYSVSTGYSNTLVGDNSTANNTITTGSGNLGLGSNVFFPSATANSQLNIGNLIYGSLPATTTAFQLPTTGSLGIGSSTPWAKFSIATNNGDTNPMLFAIGSSTASATTTLFSINNTGLISGLNLNLTGGATSTSFAITGTASTTGLIVSSAGGTPGCATFSASGLISNTGTACGSASGAAPFTWTTNFGVIAAATTSPIWAQNGIFASSTSHFANLDYSGMLGFATSSANASSTIFTFNGRSFIIASTSNGYLSGGNTGVGLDALSNLTSGSINTALGYQALQLATSAAQNTAIGYQALQYLETGTDNTAVGYGALFTIYGSRNTVVGSGAANQGGAPGDDNIAVGYSTGPVNGGSQNIVIGNEAMWMAAGKNNVLLGYQNLTNAWRSAYNSTLIGNQAGYSLGYSNGDTTGSTFLGFQAGFNVDDGYGNLLIGASSTNDLISGSNNIAIGNNTHFQSDTNNQLNIGGILFGTVPATSTAFKLPTTGSLGVGTSSPWAKFSIATNNGDTNPILFAIGSSTASATTTLFSISNTGNSFLSGTASTTGLIVSSAGGTAGCATFSAAGLISNTGTACGSGGGGTYDFPLTGNATSTLTQFNGGLTAFASSTIGNGTQAGGLTISGGATSTLGFNIASSTLGLSLNGVAALQGSTTKNNYFFGGATLPTNLLGIYNYAIGQGALANATSSFIRHNFAVGYQAGQNATGGYYNNFIGEQAGQNNAGFNNNFLGYQVGTSNTTGSYNNFMAGGGSNTTGGYNNYLGSASGAQSTTGSNNNFFGSYAGFNNITGSNNNFIGNQVGYSNTTGYSNTFIGDSSVGYATGNITTGSGNIGLGSNVFFPSATGNRQLNIGNLIYGTLPATSTAFQLPTTGSLGIGSSTPWAKFSIATNNGDTNPILFAIGSSTQSATTTLFSISNTGTASTTGLIVSSAGGTPGCATFSAAGLISNTGTACGSGGSSAYDFPLTGNATSTLTQFNGGLTAYASSTIGNGTQAGGLTINGGATTTGNAYFPTQSSTITGNKILTLGSVNGTYGPTSLTLENESGANGPIFSTAGSSVNLIDFGFIPGSGAQQNIRLEARSTSTYGTGNSAGEFQIGTMGSTPNPNLIIGAGTTAVRNGNFGVGTTSPFANLSIQANNGSTNTMLFAIGSSTASNTSTLAYFDNNGSFFVGTSTNQGFHVINNAATAGNGLSITTTPAPVNVNSSGGGVTLSTVSNAGNENLTIQSKGVSSLVLSSPSGSIVLSANSAGMTVSQRQINMAPFAPNSSGFVFNYNSNSGPASLAASTEVPMVAFNTNITDSHNNGAIALQRNFLIKAASETFTTYSKSNSITNAATLGIDSAPMAGINGTTTNAYGILVGSSTPSVMFNASTTNSYGLGVFAGAGAQNNYAAIFNGGNVGVGTTTPFANFSLHANNGDTNTTLFAIGSSTQSATTTLFSISNTGTASTTGLIVSSAGGTPGCATFSASGLISNTGTACGSGGGGTYDFPLTGNATSTLTQFNGGLTAFASSTIGNGTQAGGLTINGGATTTGNAYFAGNVGIGTTNPGALLTVNGTASTTNVTISALGGQAGNCLGIDSSGVVIGQSCSGAAGASLTAANTWTQLQTFQLGINSQASSTIGNGTQAGGVTISGGATTTGFLVVQGNSTSTFAAGLQTSALNVTSATASSTFASGINISSGCFAIGGTCLSTGGGASLTGSVGQAAYFSGTNTAVGTSSLFISTASNVGIGTSTPYGKLTVWGADSAAGTLAFLVANSASTTAFSVDDAGNGFVSSKFSIGTTSTLSALVVSGSASVGADYNVAAPANGFIVEGNVGIGTTTPTRKLSVTDTVANPQVMVSYDQTRYSTMQVDASGNLTIHASNGGVTQGGITFSDDNVWVCQSGTCPVLTASSTSGNLFVENGVVLGDGFRLQEINTTDLGLYDTNGALMVTFDHGL